MADNLKIARLVLAKPMVIAGIAVIMAAPCSVWAAGEGLTDPTLSSTQPAAVGNGPNAVGSGEPVLQSVLLSPGRKVAYIDGQAYKVGDRVGEMTLVRMNDHEAVLRNADGSLKTLDMHPGVVKKAIVQPPEGGGALKTKRPVKKAGQGT